MVKLRKIIMFRFLLLKSIVAGILFYAIILYAMTLEFNPFLIIILFILLIVGSFAGSYWVKSEQIAELLLVVGIGGIICLVITILLPLLILAGFSTGFLKWDEG
jgi:hypothetical protein